MRGGRPAGSSGLTSLRSILGLIVPSLSLAMRRGSAPSGGGSGAHEWLVRAK
jgi:hypothetical protein